MGLRSPSVYFEAMRDREAFEKKLICGDTIKTNYKQGTITRTEPEGRVRSDGTPFVHQRKVYDPTRWGGMFPYSVRFALYVTQEMHHGLISSHRSLRDKVSFLQTRGETPSTVDLEKVNKIELLSGSMKRLIPSLNKSDFDAPLSPIQQAQFDALMNESFASNAMWETGNTFAYNALVALTVEAINSSRTLSSIPRELLAYIEPTTLPSHQNSEHFLTGPKGCGTNPTGGRGIRVAQFSSDHAVRFMFGDGGIIDFWIDEHDLTNNRWDRAWAATAGG